MEIYKSDKTKKGLNEYMGLDNRERLLEEAEEKGGASEDWKVVLGYGTQPLSIVGNEIGRFEGGWRDSAQPICMREKTYLLNSILIARVLKVCAANLTNFVKRR